MPPCDVVPRETDEFRAALDHARHYGVDVLGIAEVQDAFAAAEAFLAGKPVDVETAVVTATRVLDKRGNAVMLNWFEEATRRFLLKHQREIRGKSLVEARRSPRCMPRARSPRRHVRRRRTGRCSSRSEPDEPDPPLGGPRTYSLGEIR